MAMVSELVHYLRIKHVLGTRMFNGVLFNVEY